MTTLQSMIDESKRHLLSYQREPRNKLAAAYTAGGSSLTFTYDLAGIKAGSLIEVDLELFYVWEVNEASKTATVDGAQQGSIAANHDVSDRVIVNPRFPEFAVKQALNQEILALASPSNGLFRVAYADLTSSASRVGYDLTGVTSIIDVMEVRERSVASSFKSWPRVPHFNFDRSVSTTDFPSGFALFLTSGSASGQPLRIQYKAGFTALANLSDDALTVAGLPLSAQDIPPIGAAIRLAAPREIKRNFTESQGDTRRADEVQGGSISGSVRELQRLYQRRITEEAAALMQVYPPREAMSYGVGGSW